jgi:dTDP-4-dehydrorhamnose 3,5-epimerase
VRVTATAIAGAVILEPEVVEDERGIFARILDTDVLERHGLQVTTLQRSVAYNRRRGTLRGLHWQDDPAVETKLVRCTRGRVWDVVVDLRPDSATFLHHVAVELTADNRLSLLVPPRVAHGYQSLTDATEVCYDIDAPYTPAAARGLRWDDPALGIPWPLEPTVMSDRDRAWALWEAQP